MSNAQIKDLIYNGTIIQADELLSYSMMYYDTLITVLIALLGLSAFLGYVYIRGITRKRAEETVRNAVSGYFEKEASSARIKTAVSDEVAGWIDDNIREAILSILDNLEESGNICLIEQGKLDQMYVYSP